jgi:tetratricopeptide (TPR) repeat protein
VLKIQSGIMQSKKNSIRLTFFLFLLFAGNLLVFAGGQDISAVKAMQLFDAGNYPEAEKMFSHLLKEDPGNPMLNYYYGACRTENGQYSDHDMGYLENAQKSMNPDRLNYYLGIQHHARNNWEQALRFYNKFRMSVPENEQQRLNLTQKIQQCYEQENPFEREETSAPPPLPAEKTELPETPFQTKEEFTAEQPEPERQENFKVDPQPEYTEETEMLHQPVSDETDSLLISAEIPEIAEPGDFSINRQALPDLPGVKPTFSLPSGNQLEFQVNSDITYLYDSQFQTAEGKELFKKARALKEKLENDRQQAERWRRDYRVSVDPEEKAALGEKILTYETESINLREMMNRFFSESRRFENEFWQAAGSVEVNNFLIELDKIKAVLTEKDKTEAPKDEPAEDFPAALLPENLTNMYDNREVDTVRPKRGQLVYKIQIGAYSRGVPAYRQRLYNKLSMIRRIENYTDENGVVVYTTGNLTSLEDAEKMRHQVRQEGIQDAIVVPYFNGKRITLEQAKKMEAGDDIERN